MPLVFYLTVFMLLTVNKVLIFVEIAKKVVLL